MAELVPFTLLAVVQPANTHRSESIAKSLVKGFYPSFFNPLILKAPKCTIIDHL